MRTRRSLWAKALGGAGLENLENLSTDAAGNPYIVGNFTGLVDFGGGAVSGPPSMSVVKYTSDGVFVSAAFYNGTHTGGGVDMDGVGDIFVGGQGVGLAPNASLLTDGGYFAKLSPAPSSCGGP